MGVVMMMMVRMAVCMPVAIVGAMAVLARVVVCMGRFRAVGVLCMGVIVCVRMLVLVAVIVCVVMVMAVVLAAAVRLGDFSFPNHLHTRTASMPAAQIRCSRRHTHRLPAMTWACAF